MSLLRKVISNQERQLKRLLLVQPRVAEGGIVGRQVILDQALAPAEALRHGVAGQLEVQPAEVAALLLVDAQGVLQLGVDV